MEAKAIGTPVGEERVERRTFQGLVLYAMEWIVGKRNIGVCAPVHVPSRHSTANFYSVKNYLILRRTAVRMPRNISTGSGGQPGTVTSTGTTLATRPQLA